MQQKFYVGRNDNQPFQDAKGSTHTVCEFLTCHEASAFIAALPNQESVEAGDYYLDPPEGWNGEEVAPKLFILWDRKDGPNPPRDEAGEILTSGVLGRLGRGNVYLTTYGARPDGSKTYDELELGEAVRNVRFSLSGSSGEYDVYRVA